MASYEFSMKIGLIMKKFFESELRKACFHLNLNLDLQKVSAPLGGVMFLVKVEGSYESCLKFQEWLDNLDKQFSNH